MQQTKEEMYSKILSDLTDITRMQNPGIYFSGPGPIVLFLVEMLSEQQYQLQTLRSEIKNDKK